MLLPRASLAGTAASAGRVWFGGSWARTRRRSGDSRRAIRASKCAARWQDAVAELARARVAVAPILAGSGTRLKIIEAWAAGVPVVSTPWEPKACRPVTAKTSCWPGMPAAFADAVTRLLACADLRDELGRSGRLLMEKRVHMGSRVEKVEFLTTDSGLHSSAILKRPMRFAVDAHAIGRHLTGNEVYIRSLLNAFASQDPESRIPGLRFRGRRAPVHFLAASVRGGSRRIPFCAWGSTWR